MSEVEFKDYKILDCIDADEISIGYRAKDTKTDEIVYLRKYRKETKEFFYLNYVYPLTCGITGIAKCIGYQNSEDNIIIFTEYMKNGSLSEILYQYLKLEGQKSDKMNPTVRSKIIFGISSIMKKVHQHNIIHLNLQPKCIFLDDNLEPRINNFGIHFSNLLGHLQIGSPFFWSPEFFMNAEYDSSTDVYSFAFLICAMFSNQIKLDHHGQINTRDQLKSIICKGKRLIRPESIPDCYWELVCQCWDQSPKKRSSFNEITEILKNDKFAIEEYGMKTNLDELHEYQERIDND